MHIDHFWLGVTCVDVGSRVQSGQQSFLLARRIEWLALLNPDRRCHPQKLRREHLGGLALDHLIQFLVELEIVGMDGVHI